ncbi:hypothetical protein H3C61_02620 [Candidatus Gracilibacteria bacterium]|nr:hypothetical protein [Candidatus Gracilibacteria bacterium]
MKKTFIKIFLLFSIIFSVNFVNAGNIDFKKAQDATSKIKDVSINAKTGDMKNQVGQTTNNILKTFKIVIGGLLVIYLVYAGTMMVISMGSDEARLSESKRSIWYAIIGLLFVNIPGLLYSSFSDKRTTDDITSTTGDGITIYQRNIFMNSSVFGNTLGNIITFLEIVIVGIAIFMIVYSGIKIIIASGDEEKVSESKKKILWSLAGLIFIGIMEVWRNVMFKGDFKGQGQELFATLANLALFFAGPIAIFFLSLAGYYYITSGGDDDKVKKAKSIVFNTLIAVLILVGTYTILLDLKTLNF